MSNDPENITELNNDHVLVIRVQRPDGTVFFPAVVHQNSSNWKEDISDASDYFEKDGQVDVVTAKSLLEAGVNNPEETMEWSTYRENLYNAESHNPTEKHLAKLTDLGLSSRLIDMIENDLRVSDNEEMILAQTKLISNEKDRNQINKALEIAKKAHDGQTQKRPQDKEGLDNIPYFNHPIQVANLAFQLKLSPEAIQAALLHDVLEDTEVTAEELKKEGFNEKTMSLVADLTKNSSESRDEYMKRVAGLKGESKLLKCLDRYQNILRAFSIKDKKYIDRYIRESKETYLPAFLEYEELSDLAVDFDRLIEELEKYTETLE